MIALRTNTYFMVTLNSRNYHGKLDFNHEKESLELIVSDKCIPGIVWFLEVVLGLTILFGNKYKSILFPLILLDNFLLEMILTT